MISASVMKGLRTFLCQVNAVNASIPGRLVDIHTALESPRKIERFEMYRGYVIEKMT